MNRTPFQLACIDMAGTTVSDDGAVMAAFEAALRAGGLPRRSSAYQEAETYALQTMGQSKIDVFSAIFNGDGETAALANEAFERAYGAHVASGGIAEIPGAGAALDALRGGGIRVCLTTGFSPDTRDAVITALDWKDRIDLALSPIDAGRGRPYPDMILHAALCLGADDVAAIAVAGDTASDLLAGHRAGAGIVAGVLTGAHDLATLAAAPHTHLLDSIAELPRLVLS